MNIIHFADRFLDRFFEHKTSTWAASLAFYTALSLAPLLILFLTISARLSADLQESFLIQVQGLLGPVASQVVDAIIQSAKNRPDLISVSGAIGTVTILLSASLIFGEMRAALDQIFELEKKPDENEKILATFANGIKARVLQIGLVFGFIFAMIVSLLISTVINLALQQNPSPFASSLNIVVSFILYIAIFTALFRYLPSRRLPWRQASQGGALTALLFVIGKELIGVYLGNSALNSSYGAAGSVVVLLAWVYYSSMIIFVGAHVSFLLQQPIRSRVAS